MKFEYICSLPTSDKIGGELVKNESLYNYFKENKKKFNLIDIEQLKHKKIILFAKCIWSLINPFTKRIVISKSSRTAYTYLKIANILNVLNKEIYYFVIGGNLHKILKEEKFNIRRYKKIKKIYVESRIMLKELNDLGLNNIEYLPNFKSFNKREYFIREIKKPLKCIFFSRITPEKGTEMIFKMLANNLFQEIEVDFYGPIEREYKQSFFEKIEKSKNANYKGILDTKLDKTYNIIEQYDLMLFPTNFRTEGIPGTILDSLISGVPILSSKWDNYNEILNEDIAFNFKIENQLDFEKELLNILKNLELLTLKRKRCYEESKKYEIESVLKNIF